MILSGMAWGSTAVVAVAFAAGVVAWLAGGRMIRGMLALAAAVAGASVSWMLGTTLAPDASALPWAAVGGLVAAGLALLAWRFAVAAGLALMLGLAGPVVTATVARVASIDLSVIRFEALEDADLGDLPGGNASAVDDAASRADAPSPDADTDAAERSVDALAGGHDDQGDARPGRDAAATPGTGDPAASTFGPDQDSSADPFALARPEPARLPDVGGILDDASSWLLARGAAVDAFAADRFSATADADDGDARGNAHAATTPSDSARGSDGDGSDGGAAAGRATTSPERTSATDRRTAPTEPTDPAAPATADDPASGLGASVGAILRHGADAASGTVDRDEALRQAGAVGRAAGNDALSALAADPGLTGRLYRSAATWWSETPPAHRPALAGAALIGGLLGLLIGLVFGNAAARLATAFLGAAILLVATGAALRLVTPDLAVRAAGLSPVVLGSTWLALGALGAAVQWRYRPDPADIGR